MTTGTAVKKPGATLKSFIYWTAIVFAVYEVLFISGLLQTLVQPISTLWQPIGRLLYPQATLPIHLGFMLLFTYLLYSGGKGKTRLKVPWYDWILAAIGLGWNLYLVINFDDVYLRLGTGTMLSSFEVVTCWISFVILLEAVRRTMGMPVAIVGAVFILYTFMGQYLPGILSSPPLSAERIARGMGLFVNGVYGDVLNVSATIIFAFIMFGVFLNLSGAGDWFLKIANSVMGTIRGGSSKVAIVANALMGMVQGSGVAIVASIGVLTIPMMKKNGYTPEMSGAIEAAAANGGQIMPPVMGIAAFIMVDFLGVGYDKIMLAGFLPALIYYLALYFQTDFEASRLGLTGTPRSELPGFKRTFAEGWFYILPIVLLLVMMLQFNYSAQISALIATVLMIGLSWLRKDRRIGLKRLAEGFSTTSTSMAMVAVMCALAGVIVASVNITGLSFRLSGLLLTVAGGNLPLLLVLSAIVAIILGMGMPTSAVYVVLATLVAPALVQMGIQPMAAHMFLFYFGVQALITPPVAPAAFVAAALAGSPPMKTGWISTRLAIAGFLVPFVFVFKPDMLLQGNVLMGLWNAIEATIVVFGVSSALGGFLFRQLSIWQRILIGLGGLVMLYPYSWVATVGGIILIAIPTLIQGLAAIREKRKTRAVTKTA